MFQNKTALSAAASWSVCTLYVAALSSCLYRVLPVFPYGFHMKRECFPRMCTKLGFRLNVCRAEMRFLRLHAHS